MSPRPVMMRNRWLDRPEPAPGAGEVYWHILLRDYPQVRQAVTGAQRILSDLSGFHMTPHEWLHITVLHAGPTERISHATWPPW